MPTGNAYPDHVYHLTSPAAWEQIRQCGGLIPQMSPLGNYTFEVNSFRDHWTRPTRFFGSAVQGLALGLFGRGHERLVLLRLRIDPAVDEISVQDLSSLFDRLDMTSYMNNVYSYGAFQWGGRSIPELMVRTRSGEPFPLDRIEVLHEVDLASFGTVAALSSRRFDPQHIRARILGVEHAPLPWRNYRKIRFAKWHYRLLMLRELMRRRRYPARSPA